MLCVFSYFALKLSFFAMSREELNLSADWGGDFKLSTALARMPASHRHDELELNLVRTGRATYLLGDQRYDLARNTLVWLFPSQEHILLDRSPDHQMWIGLFKPSLLGSLVVTPEKTVLCEAAPLGHFCRQVSEADGRRLETLIQDVDAARSDPTWFNAGLGYVLLSVWSAYCAAGDGAGFEVHPAVEKAVGLLRDEQDALTAPEIAARVGMSAPYLGRLFHQQTGVTLADFRNRQRLERFLDLYGDGSRFTILEAALETGFGSYPQVYRIFTQQMGCSPAAYRRRQHNNR